MCQDIAYIKIMLNIRISEAKKPSGAAQHHFNMPVLTMDPRLHWVWLHAHKAPRCLKAPCAGPARGLHVAASSPMTPLTLYPS